MPPRHAGDTTDRHALDRAGLGTASIIRGDARHLPLPDGSVDLVVTSPPYFALRSYTDGGEHYAGQIGSEPTPAEFVDALIDVTRECVRVLKPTGSLFVNLGDKYSTGTSGDRNSGFNERSGNAPGRRVQERSQIKGHPAVGFPPKTLLGIPWRYALRCIDDLGLILRAEIVWAKPNGLPESVTDRVRRSHEQWFHLVAQPRYFSAVDEIREQTDDIGRKPKTMKAGPLLGNHGSMGHDGAGMRMAEVYNNPLGKLPGSVWTIPTEPLIVPDHLGVDHFAAFPTAWPKRIIQGWSPAGVCVECGQGRRPVVTSVGLDMDRPQARRAQQLADDAGLTEAHLQALLSVGVSDTGRGKATQNGTGRNTTEVYALADHARSILGGYSREYLLRRPTGLGYACGCNEPTAPTTPARILDPFGGTGTTALVAKALGRHGISADMSHDYCRLAQWRTNDRGQLGKVLGLTKAPPVTEGQLDLFGGVA